MAELFEIKVGEIKCMKLVVSKAFEALFYTEGTSGSPTHVQPPHNLASVIVYLFAK